jgi:hypothetical protein
MDQDSRKYHLGRNSRETDRYGWYGALHELEAVDRLFLGLNTMIRVELYEGMSMRLLDANTL